MVAVLANPRLVLLAIVGLAAVSAVVWVVGRRRHSQPETTKRILAAIWLPAWSRTVSKGETLAAALAIAALLTVVIVLALA
jgi:hypothetical protein